MTAAQLYSSQGHECYNAAVAVIAANTRQL